MKKFISVILAITMLLSISAVFVYASTGTDTSGYTKLMFTDGGADFTNTTPMNMDKWSATKIGAGSYSGSEVTEDGYLTVYAATQNEIWGVTPKDVTIPDNYVAEMTGVFSNRYCHNAAIRLKTVGTVNYYLLACWDGTSSADVKYGIATSITADMNAVYLSDTFSIARETADKSAEWRFVVAGDTIEVYVNSVLKLTYTNADFAGEEAVTHFDPVFYSPNNYNSDTAKSVLKISGINIYREMTAIERAEASFTKVFFEDGGSDNSVNPMTMDKWTKTTVGAGNYNSSNVTSDGYLEVCATTSNEIHGVTPNTAIPNDYTAEFSGKFYSAYNHQTAVRFKTVGSTNYYVMSTYIGDSKTKYGIGTDTTLKKDMNGVMVSGAPTFTLSSTDAATAADWKIVVSGDTVALYRNGELKLTYTNADFAGTGAVTHFDPVFFSYSYTAETAKKVLNITSAKLYREESAIEKAEGEMTAVIYDNDFEDETEINTGDWNLWSANAKTQETFRISDADGKKAMEIAQLEGSLNRATTAFLNTGDAADYTVEAKMKIGSAYPDAFAIRFRNSSEDGDEAAYYALGYSRWLNNSAGCLGVTKPNGYKEAGNYNKVLTSYGKAFISEWHDYKIVVSGMTAAIYIDGNLVSEQVLNEGYEKGGIAFTVFNMYGGVTNGPISMYLDSVRVKTYPAEQTRLFGVRRNYDAENGTLKVTAKVFADADATINGGKAILVVYEGENAVKAVTEDIDVAANKAGESVELSVSGLDAEKTYSARLFVWDGFDNIVPVTAFMNISL